MAEQDAHQAEETVEIPESEEALAALLEEAGESENNENAEPEIEYKGQKLKASKEVKQAWDEWQGEFTRKTMSLADERKGLESEREKIRNEAQVFTQFRADFNKLDSLNGQIAEFDKITPEQWAAAYQNDDKATGAAQLQYNLLLRQRNELAGSLNQRVNEATNKASEAQKTRRAEAEKELALKVKGWSNERAAELRGFAASTYGFTPQELESSPLMLDPRVVQALTDVMTVKNALARAKNKASQQQAAEQQQIVPITPAKPRGAPQTAPRDEDPPDVWLKKFNAQQKRRR